MRALSGPRKIIFVPIVSCRQGSAHQDVKTRSCDLVNGELARGILPRPQAPTPAGDKPPHYISHPR